ncbi:MAG: substrate-binding domain-containing protein, partial [Curvibacter sp.]|nr:substrate-binding domain-containing protein [Curvibacter sp.]
ELLSYQRTITARRTDAFIVARTRVHDERLQLLSQAGTPFVAYGRSQLDRPYAWFDFDNEAGGRLAADRLIGLGHTRLAYLGAPAEYNFAAQRFAGFMARCAQDGAVPRPGHILRDSLDRRSGYAAMQHLLSLEERPTALLVDNHLAGTGALHALQNAGLQPGRDLSIVVYDGLSADSVIRSEVTSVLQVDETLVGRTLAEMVLARLEGVDAARLQTLWQPTLKVGASDGPPPPR